MTRAADRRSTRSAARTAGAVRSAGVVRSVVETLEGRQMLHADAYNVTFNFQPESERDVKGTITDYGVKYSQQSNGYVYGWNKSNRANMRVRDRDPNLKLDTLAQFQEKGKSFSWEAEVPDGDYEVTMWSGDTKYIGDAHVIWAEDVRVMYGITTKKKTVLKTINTVTVSDGRLTIKIGSEAQNAKIQLLQIRAVHDEPHEPDPEPVVLPTVTMTTTADTATEGGSAGNIRLTRTGDLSAALTVQLAWSGSAGASDIQSRPGSVTFAAGSATVDVPVVAIDDDNVESDETATLAFVANDALYIIGAGDVASVRVVSNDVAPDPDPDPTFSNITWSGATAPPVSYSETTSITANGKIYLFGGFNGSFQAQTDAYAFNGTSWQTLASSPKGFTHVGHVEAQSGVFWFIGGYIRIPGVGQQFGTTEVFTYNANTDTWGTGPSLPEARASGTAAKIGNVIYYTGGENAGRANDVTTTYAYDLDNPGAGWVTKAALPMARTHAAGVVVDSKLYILGGQTGYDGGLTAYNDIQVYNPSTNTWTVPSQKLPAVRSHISQSTFLHRGKIVVVTGQNVHNGQVNTVWSIDPTTLATSVLNTFPDSRFSAAGGILNDKLYIFGGYKGTIASTGYVGTFV